MNEEQHWKKVYNIRPNHIKIRALVEPKLKFIQNYVNIDKDTKILDVGCGDGRFTYYFEKLSDKVTGIDISSYLLSINPGKNLLKADAYNLPFKNNSFDICFCSDLLHHLENPLKALNEMIRVSKKYVIIIEPNRLNPFIILNSLKNKEWCMFNFNLKKTLNQTNLKLIKNTTLGFISYKKIPTALIPIFMKFKGHILGSFNLAILEKEIKKKKKMKIFKSLAYKILKLKIIDEIITLLSPIFLKVPNLKKGNKKQPFYICVTVDTEPGHIRKNLTRAWMTPSDFQGYYTGIRFLRETASAYGTKLTFLLSTQCFTAQPKELKKIIDQLKRSFKAGHEIGLHLHPRRDLALHHKLNEKLKYTASKFYSEAIIIKILNTQRNLVKANLGEEIESNIISFRWGNYALHENAFTALEKKNFKIDTSTVPNQKGHLKDSRIYDWSNIKTHYPFFLKDSKVLEIPITTFKFLGFNLKADPFLNSSLLINSFKHYYNNASRENKPFIFVVITHSSEALYSNGKKSYVVGNLEVFLKYCSKFKDVKFVTLKEAYNNFI